MTETMATTCRYTPCDQDATEEVEVGGAVREFCGIHAREAIVVKTCL